MGSEGTEKVFFITQQPVKEKKTYLSIWSKLRPFIYVKANVKRKWTGIFMHYLKPEVILLLLQRLLVLTTAIVTY